MSHRRKASKRRVDSDDDWEEDGDSDPLNISPRKQHTTTKRKRVSDAAPDRLRLDVESKVQHHIDPSSQSPAREPTPPSRHDKTIGANKRSSRQKKTRTIVESEDEDKAVEEDLPDSPPHLSHDEDEEYLNKEAKRSEPPTKQKAPMRRKYTKISNTDSAAKARRGRAKKETKESLAKNEGDNARVSQAASQAQDDTTGRYAPPRLKEIPTEETNTADPISDLSAATTSELPKTQTTEVAETGKDATPPQPPPPPAKKKLPTIKKVKAPVMTTPSTPVPPKSAGIPHQVDAAEVGKLPAVETRVIAANVGSTDFDLRKPSVYAELFRPVSFLMHVHVVPFTVSSHFYSLFQLC